MVCRISTDGNHPPTPSKLRPGGGIPSPQPRIYRLPRRNCREPSYDIVELRKPAWCADPTPNFQLPRATATHRCDKIGKMPVQESHPRGSFHSAAPTSRKSTAQKIQTMHEETKGPFTESASTRHGRLIDRISGDPFDGLHPTGGQVQLRTLAACCAALCLGTLRRGSAKTI